MSAEATTELFKQVYSLLNQTSLKDKLLLKSSLTSFEITSTRKEGIRYIVRVPKSKINNIEKSFRGYLPSCKIKRINDYLAGKKGTVIEFKQTRHFALPLRDHSDLSKHDPIAYLAANIKQLGPEDLLAIQLTLSPLKRSGELYNITEARRLTKALNNKQYIDWSKNDIGSRVLIAFLVILDFLTRMAMTPFFVVAEFLTGKTPEYPDIKIFSDKPSPKDQDFSRLAKAKLSEPLFSSSLRISVYTESKQTHERISGISAAIGNFNHSSGQSLVPTKNIFKKIFNNFKYNSRFNSNLALTPAEAASIFHFPFKDDAYNDDMQKVRSRELPAPLSIKNKTDLDVIFGKNTFSNSDIEIGLSDDDRSRHVYMIGQTGSGKTTIIYHMAADDINKGRGVAVVDPHGDLAEDLLNRVPDERADELIYFDPFDVKFPIGINLLEIEEGLSEDDLELEKELVCESVVAIFRRVFFKDENVDAHRIEYILRNAIYSAFCQEDCTIFTVYDLLNNKDFRKQAIKNITDKNLLNFWKNEFGKAGDYQHVKMVGGVTAKIGRFLFSPIAKRILEQPKSTINFDDILESGKILICNLAEGKLGEDTSQLLGATIIAKTYQAAMRRVRIERDLRQPFYLFVDEFQNFATSSFTKVLSGGRKFGLRITIAEQSTAQQKDQNITNVVLANTGTAICFRTASPVDERLMLPQFAPHVEPGDIANLPRFRFYIKMAAIEPEEPFSGITLPILSVKKPERLKHLKDISRKNYAIEYSKPKEEPIKKESKDKKKQIKPSADISSLT
ncbi:MAG: AAA-like domain protein [bacterium ADurb.Bin212]|nr:MAG: AAA-like domain protein [bacterium ADurb.Bin212]